ncbi:MAG: TatD family hydrolase [Hyphomicrobiaceae bacterium]|nr:TatD family hydrolase [Hyphomicrobiaceae bacterium]
MLVDHHCHLDFPDFAEDLPGVVERARAAGVGTIVTISTLIRRFDTYRAIAEAHDDVWFSVGTHPHTADEERDIPAAEIIRLSAHPKCVAIGEAGLDYHYKKSSPEGQAQGFRTHIEAARETGLPLEIHTREADADTLAILTEEHAKGAFPAVLHCFTGGRELALRAVDLGLYVSFSGIATFKTAQALRDIAAEIPLDRILVETDAPYLAPLPFRGKSNEPAYVVHTAAAIAAARGLSLDAFAQASTDNFFRLYTKARRPQSPVPLAAPASGAGGR